MKTILIATIALTVLTSGGIAAAADLPLEPSYKAPPPRASWTACYAGIHGGWGWGTEHVSTHSYFFGVTTRSNEGSIDTSGALLGGQVGCDFQVIGNFVIGIQADYAKMRIVGDIQDPHDGSNINDVLRFQTDGLASVTGRLGVVGWSNQVLVYVKGGGAWANSRYDFRSADRSALRGTYEVSYTGWTIGAGIEWALAYGWSVFAEFNHYGFGNTITTVRTQAFGAFSEDYQVKAPSIDVAKFGVNYRLPVFGG